jgi:hypothetical protein
MLKLLEEKVAKRTLEYDKQVPEQLRVTDDARDEAREIARKQGRVEDLTRKLADRLNKNAQFEKEHGGEEGK